MKQFILLISLFFGNHLFSQNNYSQFTIDSFYQDKSTFLISSKVISLEGKTQQVIRNEFKKWASLNFVNLKEVMVSETDEQIVIVYLTGFYNKFMGSSTKVEWYIRLVADFKDNKIRIKFIDDGNALWSGTTTHQRTYKLSQYFEEWGKDGEPSKRFKQGLIDFKSELESFSNSVLIQKNVEDW